MNPKSDLAKIAKRLIRNVDHAWRMATSPYRSFPGLVIIGTQKGGTTSLYNYLCDHPQIQGALPRESKEVHYFNKYYHRNPLWYKSHFNFRGVVSIEKTPAYMFNRATLWRMAKLLPDRKTVAVLRDPVSRAFSHYHHCKRGMGKWGNEHRPIEKAIREDLQRAKAGPILGTGSYSDVFHSYIRRGMYYPQIKRFKEIYGDNLRVIQSEALFSNPNSVINELYDFLGLPSHDLEDVSTHNSGTYQEDTELRDKLEAFFEPHNQQLYELLDCEEWWSY